MASGIDALTGSQSSSETQGSSTKKTLPADPLAQKETFLKLLVAQIKNQNPLNPADGMQFVSQLAQFSELEQVVEMQSELSAIRDKIAPAETDGSGSQTTDGSQGA